VQQRAESVIEIDVGLVLFYQGTTKGTSFSVHSDDLCLRLKYFVSKAAVGISADSAACLRMMSGLIF
jgi:hypothetical protein